MTYLLQRDQEQQRIQDETVKEIYLSGIGDGFDGRLPMMAELIYLQGYCVGMQQLKTTDSRLAIAPTEQTELPLLCGQCTYLNNGKCAIKSVVRNSSNYACDRVVFDCPF